MKFPLSLRQLRRGFTLVETLVAGLLLSIGIMGLVSIWLVSFRVTENTDNAAIAYNLGRHALERIKLSGFPSAAEGTSDYYYDGNQTVVSAGSSRFWVTTSVVSDSVESGTSGQAGAVPADDALRTVTITVRLQSTAAVLYTTSTYLARAGI